MRCSLDTISTFGLAMALSALCFWPVGAAAQSISTSASVDQVRAAFVTRGYQVDLPLKWEWTSPPVTTFRVTDQTRDRLLVVLVYPGADAAQSAARREGARLVLGFGPSTWRGNVALVQTSPADLNRAYRAQNALDDGMDGDRLVDPPLIGTRVDFDFLEALDTSVTIL